MLYAYPSNGLNACRNITVTLFSPSWTKVMISTCYSADFKKKSGSLVSLVILVYLVSLVYLVCLVFLVEFAG
jgi:hypothetical protein